MPQPQRAEDCRSHSADLQGWICLYCGLQSLRTIGLELRIGNFPTDNVVLEKSLSASASLINELILTHGFSSLLVPEHSNTASSSIHDEPLFPDRHVG